LRIFLDANILFSAAKSDGAVRLLLGMLRRAGHECWADPYVVEEARRNLTLKLPDCPDSLDSELRHLHVAPRHTVDTALAITLWAARTLYGALVAQHAAVATGPGARLLVPGCGARASTPMRCMSVAMWRRPT